MDARTVIFLATFGFTDFLSLILILKRSRASMNSPSGGRSQNTGTEKLTYNWLKTFLTQLQTTIG